MISALTIWMFLTIQVPISASETVQLMQLVKQSQLQLQELSQILNSSETTSRDLRKAVEISEKLSAGIDKTLKPLEGSRVYQEAAMKLQKKRLEEAASSSKEMETSGDDLPQASKHNQEEQGEFYHYQHHLHQATQADMNDLKKLEQRLVHAKPGEVEKLNALTILKDWESNLRLSSQLTALLEESRTLRQQLQQESNNEQQEWENEFNQVLGTFDTQSTSH